MATRQERCSYCGFWLQVPPGELSVYCPECRKVKIFQGRSNANVAPQMSCDVNNWQGNRHAPSPGFVADNYRRQPLNSVAVYERAYLMPVQPYSPPAHGQKRAVLCGITYKGHKRSLRGSYNDVQLMKNLLIGLGFPTSSILVLTEEERNPYCIPTKQNIRLSLSWLAQGCRSGDSLVFYYSGHGGQVRDRDGDEIDGYDESLLPVDYETEGRILDDEINATIVRPLPRGAKLCAIIDTCSSGTFLDLPYVCRMNREGYYKWDDHRVLHAFRGTSGGHAISLSACDDHQNTGDMAFAGTAATGVLTKCFVKTLEQETEITYGDLLMYMHGMIRKTQDVVGLKWKSQQDPQLSSSQKFGIHSTLFTL